MMRNPTEETLSLPHHAEKSFIEWFRIILVRIPALKKVYTKPDQHKFLRFNPRRDETLQSIHAQKVSFTPSAACCAFSNQRMICRISESSAEPMSCGKGSDFCSSKPILWPLLRWHCSRAARDDDKRLMKFSLWISAAQFPPVDKLRGWQVVKIIGWG